MKNIVVVGVDGSDKDDVAQRFAEHGDQILETALAKVEELDPTLEVRGTKKAQPAAQLIDELSEDAELVVVGEGHRPRLHALVDGSVGHDTVAHATSAVLLVRAPKEAGERGRH